MENRAHNQNTEDEILNRHLVFSGNISASRIFYEKFYFFLQEILNFLLWLLLVAGLCALVFIFSTAAIFSFWLLFFQKNLYNLTIWLGLLAGCYLWAKIKYRQALKPDTAFEDEEPLDVYELFSPQSKQAWNRAILSHSGKFISAEGLFLALLEQSSVREIFRRIGVTTHDMETLVKIYAKLNPYKKNLSAVPFLAFELAEEFRTPVISAPLLLCALVSWLPEDHIIPAIFTNLNITLDDLKILCQWQLKIRSGEPNGLLNFCLTAAKLEMTKRYYFKYQAIKLAYNSSGKNGGAGLRLDAATKVLIRAASAAQQQNKKIIGESLVRL